MQSEKDSTNMLPAAIDTYGCLLYRLGHQTKAISVIQEAATMASRVNAPGLLSDRDEED